MLEEEHVSLCMSCRLSVQHEFEKKNAEQKKSVLVSYMYFSPVALPLQLKGSTTPFFSLFLSFCMHVFVSFLLLPPPTHLTFFFRS